MGSRGRGKAQIKLSAMPNLALAGKREDGHGTESPSSRGRGGRGNRRGNRGGRGGRGGGRGGHHDRQALIVTEGIFSEGLHCDIEKKREKVDRGVSFAINSRNGVKKEEVAKNEEESVSKPGFGGWEQEWASDEDDDRNALRSLVGGADFISDYKRGSKIPVVLPSQDEPQFVEVLTKRAKEEFEEEEEQRQKNEQEIAGTSKGRASRKDQKLLDEQFPTLKYSRQAADILNKSMMSKMEGEFFMLQLPSLVGVLAGSVEPSEIKQEIKTEPTATSEEPAIEQKPAPNFSFGHNQVLGQLTITKRGRVRMHVHGLDLDVAQASNSGHQEDVILLETDQNDATSSSGQGMLGWQPSTGENAVHNLGKVRHNLVASMNWSGVKPKSEEKLKIDSSDSKCSDVEMLSDSEYRRLQSRLKELDRESAGWRHIAESLADP